MLYNVHITYIDEKVVLYRKMLQINLPPNILYQQTVKLNKPRGCQQKSERQTNNPTDTNKKDKHLQATVGSDSIPQAVYMHAIGMQLKFPAEFRVTEFRLIFFWNSGRIKLRNFVNFTKFYIDRNPYSGGIPSWEFCISQNYVSRIPYSVGTEFLRNSIFLNMNSVSTDSTGVFFCRKN